MLVPSIWRYLKYTGPLAFRGYRDEEYKALFLHCWFRVWTDYLVMKKYKRLGHL